MLAKGAQAAGLVAVRPDFTGHQLCDAEPYVQGLKASAPFHPTAAGELAIAIADEAALRGRQATPSPTSSSPASPAPSGSGQTGSAAERSDQEWSGEQTAGNDPLAHVAAEPQAEVTSAAEAPVDIIASQSQCGQRVRAAWGNWLVVVTADQGGEHVALAGIVVTAAQHHAARRAAQPGVGTAASWVHRDQSLILVPLHS